ncbi:MAG: hypothetical protein EZS28_050824, partial [Streblomastix strix]
MMRRTVSPSEIPRLPHLRGIQKESNILEDQEYLKNLPVPDRLLAEKQFWKQINGEYIIQKGAAESWTSPQGTAGLEKILDCRMINAITRQKRFKMDGQEQFRHLIRQKDFAITIDPKDTFHHIKVSQTLYP